jgi:predicted alpha/beta superfamily hydrolase
MVQTGDLPRYEIPNSEVRQLSSKFTGSDYEILIWMPDSYGKETNRKYPVIYLLDGQWDFSNVEASIRNTFADGAIPEVILAAISFGGGTPEHLKMRAHDFLPIQERDPDIPGGGAAQFLQSIEAEVIPLIESNYRVDDSHRGLAGSSYGGIFTLYAMMMQTGLFDAYIALGPAFYWDDLLPLPDKETRARVFQSMNTRLWLGVGDRDDPRIVAGGKALYEEAETMKSDDFVLEFRIVEGEGHSGVKAEAYNRALRFVFGHLDKPVDKL